MKKLNCLRCGTPMQYMGKEQLQKGKTSFVFGDWPNLLAGALYIDLYHCPACHKLEFFSAEGDVDESLPQKTCPQCGRKHDFDYPKCPSCGYDYYGK